MNDMNATMNKYSVEMISISQAKRAIAVCVKAKVPPVLVGPVGCGKSTAVDDFVKTLESNGIEVNYQTRILSQMDLSDFSLPKEIDGRVTACPAEWIPLKEDETEESPFTIIFLDEIDRCPPEVQNITLNLILGRKINNRPIGDKVVFIGAMNGTSDMYTTEFSEAAINRMCMLYIKADLDSYTEWAENNGVSKARIAFQRFKGEEIIKKAEFEDVSFPTNRSLDKVDLIDQMIDDDVFSFEVKDIKPAIYSGMVGVPGAIEYMAFLENFKKMPDIDDIIANPTKADIKMDSSTMYSLINRLCEEVKDDATKAENAAQYFMRLPEEFKATGMTTLLEKNSEMITCPTVLKFQNENMVSL